MFEHHEYFLDGRWVYFRQGEKSYKIGSLMTYLDFNDLIECRNTIEVHEYLLNWIHASLSSFANFFNEDTEPLGIGKRKFEENNYFIYASKEFINKIKTISIRLEKFLDLDSFRLKVKLLDTEIESYIPIAKKKPWRLIRSEAYQGHETDINYIVENPVTFSFDVIGWKKGNIFHFQWGEEEKYEFRTNEIKLYLNGKEVNGE